MSSGTTPEASVVIAYYDDAADLPSQLEALSRQVDPPAFEVIVADNEGSAELSGVIRPFLERMDLRVVDATARRGCGAARNQGVAHARGELLAFCDADDIVGSTWLASLAATVRHRDVLAVGPLRLDRINAEAVWRTTIGATPEQHVEHPVLQYPFTYLGYLPFAYCGNAAVRRSTFLTLGGFDETFIRGCDDVDLSWRSIESGIPLEKVPEALLDYRQRNTPAGVWRQRRNYMRAQADMWARSRKLGRPVRGMSLRWTLVETVKLVPLGSRALLSGFSRQYAFAAHAGDVIGNLWGQMEQRVLPELRRRLRPSRLADPGAHA